MAASSSYYLSKPNGIVFPPPIILFRNGYTRFLSQKSFAKPRGTPEVPSASRYRSSLRRESHKQLHPNAASSTVSSRAFRPSRLPSEGILRPAAISQRIHSLSSNGKLQEAIDLVKSSPIYSQNTVVWNTLLAKVLEKEKYGVAYQLYTDVRWCCRSSRLSVFFSFYYT